MFTKMTLITLIGLSFFAIQHVNASPIEGASDEVLQENANLLKSVVKIEMQSFLSGGTCTATLVAQNVLLTAKHCVDSPFVNFYINEILVQKPLVVQSSTTDLAMIKFESNAKLDAALNGAQIIPISLQPNKKLYTGEVLMAGYGLTSIDLNNSGTLRAGKNNIVEGTPTLKWLYESLIKANAKNPQPDPQNIHMMAIRESVYANQFLTGNSIEVEDHAISDIIPESQAIGLPGDSGGAVMAFDDNHQPIIVGVASTVSTIFYGSTVTEITFKDTTTGTEKTVLLDKVITGDIQKNMQNFTSVLIQEGFIAEKAEGSAQPYTALKPFSYTYKLNRFAVNSYAATSYDVNAKFISETLALFAK